MEQLLTVQEYAKKYRLSRAGIYYRIGNKNIDPENVVLIPKTVVYLKDVPPHDKYARRPV